MLDNSRDGVEVMKPGNGTQVPSFLGAGSTQEVAVNPMAAGMIARQAQEVQVAAMMAKYYPRNQTQAFNRIMQTCKRPGLAKDAMYSYPRGGTKVEGPSIRLAEAVAQNWGNIDFGFIELEQKAGESLVMAFAWDLETITRRYVVFTVPHIRRVGKVNKSLDDPRDIYEMVANHAQRRVRACIMAVVPGDIIDAAIDQCNKTLKGASQEPIEDRIRSMIVAFTDFGVTEEMIEGRVGHSADSLDERELITLRKIYVSLRDQMSSREDWFDVAGQKKSNPAPKPKPKADPKPKQAAAPKDHPTMIPLDELLVALEAENIKPEDVVGYLKNYTETEAWLGGGDSLAGLEEDKIKYLQDNMELLKEMFGGSDDQ